MVFWWRQWYVFGGDYCDRGGAGVDINNNGYYYIERHTNTNRGNAYEYIHRPSACEKTFKKSAYKMFWIKFHYIKGHLKILKSAFENANIDILKGTSFIIFSIALGILIFS